MGLQGEARLACPGHEVPITPIIGKLKIQVQSYVDSEEFFIMDLEDCDALLGQP